MLLLASKANIQLSHQRIHTQSCKISACNHRAKTKRTDNSGGSSSNNNNKIMKILEPPATSRKQFVHETVHPYLDRKLFTVQHAVLELVFFLLHLFFDI